MLITLTLYCVVSWLTRKEPFNLDRMLHRGIYNLAGTSKDKRIAWSFKTAMSKIIGITPQYTRGDRVIAWGFFFYSFVYGFVICFLLVVIWNAFAPWPIAWWGHYFYFVTLLVPGFMAIISTFWFGIGGAVDLFRLFRDLRNREVNPLDCGWVEGHVSLNDKAAIDAVEAMTEAKIEEESEPIEPLKPE
jgi:hypothetical protein